MNPHQIKKQMIKKAVSMDDVKLAELSDAYKDDYNKKDNVSTTEG